ncbi:MAG: helix-turn-helix domain-containing protein [Spirochaetaceae bacterium]|jgi:two-component system response regulator YesN|nr:helix-turn-helix domain-containing protein [Spirochaetaceae bacterium]
MYSVLIVDDEEPVLESYEFMLKNFSGTAAADNPFTLAGKARSGYEALKVIYETEPDIVFMDINIPGINGLSVLEEVHKKYPRMICILSTAYERFDLAQRAIPLGVFAYLVKPVSKRTFFETLNKALDQLHSLPPTTSEYDNPKLRLMRRDIWIPMGEETWEQYRESLSLPSDWGITLLLEIETDPEKWCALAAEKLLYKYPCIYDVILNRGLFLISEDINPGVFRQKTVKMLETLLSPITWYYGLGGLYRGPELYNSCNEALTELSRRHPMGGGGGGVAASWDRERKQVTRLREKIGRIPPEEAKSLFSALWEPLFSADFNTAKLRMVSLFTLLLDDIYGVWSSAFSSAGEKTSGAVPFDPAEIMDLKDLGAWRRWAEVHFDKLLLKANSDRSGNYPLPLVKALAFIRENYIRGIQLKDVADAAGISAAHLSRLFGEHLQTTFVDHLTALRIAEAERLLRESSVSVKEAAYAVGYHDPNYFTKIFKKIRGRLPTDVKP